MEITIEEFRQEIGGLDHKIDRLDHKIELEIGKINHEIGDLKEGQHKIELKIGGLKEGQQHLDRRIVESQVKITQWVVGLFIGTAVTMATLTGVYINVILLTR